MQGRFVRNGKQFSGCISGLVQILISATDPRRLGEGGFKGAGRYDRVEYVEGASPRTVNSETPAKHAKMRLSRKAADPP